MGLFSGCLLACDIDGTLMNNGKIAERNIEKIRFFVEEGGRFSLSTGRSVGALKQVLGKIENISPSVIANGCMIYDFENSKIIYQNVIDKSDHIAAKIAAECGVDIGIEVHCGAVAYSLLENEESVDHQKYECFSAVQTDFDELDQKEWNKALFLFKDRNDIEKTKEILRRSAQNSVFVDTSATMYGRQRFYVEQFPSGVSKASALKRLCEVLNIKPGGLFAIGDYYNDLEMIEMADISAVPLVAPDDIKQKADIVCGRCEDGAVADFIEKLTEFKVSN